MDTKVLRTCMLHWWGLGAQEPLEKLQDGTAFPRARRHCRNKRQPFEHPFIESYWSRYDGPFQGII
jgi:hypothetical protein